MENQLSKITLLERKQKLILEYYLDLQDLKIQRRNLNSTIKEKEEKLSKIIQSNPEEEKDLFSDL